jgi:hypothetical protein
MFFIKRCLFLAGVLLISCVSTVFGQADALVDMLQKKGLLTQREANEIREQMFKDTREQFPGTKLRIGSWLDELKLYGDARVRYEQFWNRLSAGTLTGANEISDRTRYRYRVRLGLEAKAGDFIAGLRLASGDSSGNTADAASTNTTFDNFSAKKPINLDMAYITYAPDWIPSGDFSITAGKMENPFWETDMVFDGDITPEGFSQKVGYDLHPDLALFANMGQWILGENNTTATGPNRVGEDQFMFGFQVGHRWKIVPKKWELKQALGFYDYYGLKNLPAATKTFTGGVNNNTLASLNGNSVYAHSYNVLALNNELKIGYWEKLPIRLQGELIHNLASGAYLTDGYKLGFVLGEAKKRGNWQIGYWFERLDADATLSMFADSDFGFGGTGGEGHIIKAGYALSDWATLNLAYWNVQAINAIINNGTSGAQNNSDAIHQTQRFQFDINMKF